MSCFIVMKKSKTGTFQYGQKQNLTSIMLFAGQLDGWCWLLGITVGNLSILYQETDSSLKPSASTKPYWRHMSRHSHSAVELLTLCVCVSRAHPAFSSPYTWAFLLTSGDSWAFQLASGDSWASQLGHWGQLGTLTGQWGQLSIPAESVGQLGIPAGQWGQVSIPVGPLGAALVSVCSSQPCCSFNLRIYYSTEGTEEFL